MEITNTSFQIPKWMVLGLGGVLIVFVVLLAIDKGYEVSQNIKPTIPENTISMSAEGKVTATPDLATVNLGVVTTGSNAKDVQDENSKKVNKVIDFVLMQGIEKKDISTAQFTIYPNYNWDSGRQAITGYQANQVVTVKIRGVDKSAEIVGKILDGATNNGANEVQGVSFSFDDPDNLRQEARKIAIAKAKDKANELAQEAGLRLGKVVSISESSGYYPMPYAATDLAKGAGGGASSVEPNIQTGSQDIIETITVVFEVK